MGKLIGYLMSLLVVFNTFDGNVMKDFEKIIGSISPLADSTSASFSNINNAIDELRVSYDVNGSKISLNDLTKYYKLRLDKMKQDGKNGAYMASMALLVLLVIAAVLPVVLLMIFILKLITNKDKKEYIQNKLRPVLYFSGCNVFAIVLFSGFFLRVTNI